MAKTVAKLVGHRLQIQGVGTFFGQPTKGEWKFTRHGKVANKDQLGTIQLKEGKVSLYTHGDFSLQHPVPIRHLRDIRKVLNKDGKIKKHLITA
jgi:hypothetical protein